MDHTHLLLYYLWKFGWCMVMKYFHDNIFIVLFYWTDVPWHLLSFLFERIIIFSVNMYNIYVYAYMNICMCVRAFSSLAGGLNLRKTILSQHETSFSTTLASSDCRKVLIRGGVVSFKLSSIFGFSAYAYCTGSIEFQNPKTFL